MLKLPDQQQRVRAYALAHDGVAAHAALRGRDLDCVAIGDAQLLGSTAVDDDATVTGDVVCHLVHQGDAGIGAPGVLHAARGEQPERVVLRALAALRDDGLPDTGEIFPDRQRLVFLELLVPPVHVVLVQAPAQFGADAQQALLVRQFVAQTGLDHGLVQIPGGA